MPTTNAMTQPSRGPALWGAVFGGLQAASPLAFWWLDPATVYALGLVLIASVYFGFAVADGRQTRVVVESGVAAIFVVVAAAAVTRSAWLLVLGLGGHGLRIFGSTAPSLSLILGGGRRFALSSIGRRCGYRRRARPHQTLRRRPARPTSHAAVPASPATASSPATSCPASTNSGT